MSPRLSIIPAGAVTDQELKGRDLQVLALLGRHTNDNGWCRRSQVRMADEIGCGRGTIQRSLERLAKRRWIEIKPARPDAAGDDRKHSSSHFYRVRLDVGDPGPIASTKADDQNADAQEQGVPVCGHPCPPMDGHHITTPLNEGENAPAIASQSDNGDDDERAFAELADSWPSAAADNLAAAKRVWLSLSPDERAAAAANAAAWQRHVRKDLRRSILPALSTYLRERKWQALPNRNRATKGEVVLLEPFKRRWWRHLFDRIEHGQRVTLMLRLASESTGFTVRSEDAPTDERENAMIALQRNSPAGRAWRDHMAKLGIAFDLPDAMPVIFVPSEWPADQGAVKSSESTAQKPVA